MMDRDEKAWHVYNDMLDVMGAEALLNSVIQQMSSDEFRSAVEYIARMEGFDDDEEEEDEEDDEE